MNGKSQNIQEERLAQLKQLFPEAFSEGKLNLHQLQVVLGEEVLTDERYGLSWSGKQEVFKDIQQQTTATLHPNKIESINFNQSNHVFIEGENLEVLRTLQKSYSGKVKMIYIDPPYNTGNDSFVYPDDFSEKKTAYEKRANIKDEAGFLNKQNLWRKNTKDNGQFHSVWLSMMYPRLFLARNLLQEDGVIFLSIDDSELYNLQLLMNEIFGAENFIANMVRQNKAGGGNDSSSIAVEYDYILMYAKNKQVLKVNQQVMDVANDRKYKFTDEYAAERGKYYLRDLDYKGTYSPSGDYPIIAPDGTKIYPGGVLGKPNTWRWSPKKVAWGKENGYIVFKKRDSGWKVYIKQYQYADNEGNRRIRTVPYRALTQFLNGEGSKELKEIFSATYFSFPKSTGLLEYLIGLVCGQSDLVMDFFAGSNTTAHAVVKYNLKHETQLRFLTIQLPEILDESTDAFKAGYQNIAALSLDRIRRVLKKYATTLSPELKNNYDLGVKAFRLAPSNFKIWRSNLTDKMTINAQIEDFQQSTIENTTATNIVYELILKSGLPLTAKVEVIEAPDSVFYYAKKYNLGIVLTKIDETIVNNLLDKGVKTIICLDDAFAKNDALKTNLSLKLKKVGVLFEVVRF